MISIGYWSMAIWSQYTCWWSRRDVIWSRDI